MSATTSAVLKVGTPIGGHTCRKRPHQLNSGEETPQQLDGEVSADDYPTGQTAVGRDVPSITMKTSAAPPSSVVGTLQSSPRERVSTARETRAVLVLRKDAARLLLKPRGNEQFGRAHWVRGVGALSSHLDGNALR